MKKQIIGVIVLLWVWVPVLHAGSEPGVLVRTGTIEQMRLDTPLKAYGAVNIDPRNVMTISFAHAGAVSRLMVTEGQTVKRGALLLEFSTDPAESYAYGQAAAAVDYARQELQRTETLAQQRLATQSQLAAAQKALADAMSRLGILSRQGKGLGTERAVAPFDGIVTALNVKPGDRAASGTALLQLARTASLIVELGVEPEDVVRVSIGMPVHIRSVFEREDVSTGKVAAIKGVINPQTRLVDVLVEIPEDQADHFLPGMKVLGDVILSTRTYWVVPRSALLRDPKGDYIFQVDQNRARRVDVETVMETDEVTAIRGNFNPALKVVVQGNYELQDKMSVREDGK